MSVFNLPMPLRRLLASAYLLLALGAPLMVVIAPGEPAISLNEKFLAVEAGRLLGPRAALGEGVEKFDENVLSDQAGVVASAAADYPDGSNAVLALFDGADSARAALGSLKDMIPHHHEEQDLWATHFSSEGGEYVMLALVDHVLVMVISERESMARERLAALPALNYNHRPGLGAVLQQQSNIGYFLLMAFYVMVQWLCLRLLFSWAGFGVSAVVKNEAGGDS